MEVTSINGTATIEGLEAEVSRWTGKQGDAVSVGTGGFAKPATYRGVPCYVKLVVTFKASDYDSLNTPSAPATAASQEVTDAGGNRYLIVNGTVMPIVGTPPAATTTTVSARRAKNSKAPSTL